MSSPTSGCWIWLGHLQPNGYGTLKVGGRAGRSVYAHRVSYETHVGPIPPGLEIDHLCRVRNCVNPEHLEPVTRRVNVQRGIGPALLGRLNANKTHCSNGHPFDAANTYLRPTGGRSCKACQRARAGTTGIAHALRTHCPRGHAYDGENTYRNAKGHRLCRACNREKSRRNWAASRAAAAAEVRS